MTQALARPDGTTPISAFRPLDKYAHGLADEQPRVPWLGTISAGYKGADGYPRAVRKSDARWIHLPPEDEVNAPGLARLVEAGGYHAIDIALPFEDPNLFLQQRFERRSATRLEVFGDEHRLTVLSVEKRQQGTKTVDVAAPRRVVLAGDPDYNALAETCSVACSLFFVAARWQDQDPQIYFPDGLGVYRLRFTSRNSLREILASLSQIQLLTGGRISGIPLRLGVTFREVADAGGARREVPIWTLRFRPPQNLELTPASWQELKRKSLAEGELLRALPAPTEETAQDALEALDADLDDDVVTALRRGPRCDARWYEATWFARVRETPLESDAARAEFITNYTRGRTDSLASFLESATEAEASDLLSSVSGYLARVAPLATVRRHPRRYEEIFGDEDVVVSDDHLVDRTTGEVLSEGSSSAQTAAAASEPSGAAAVAALHSPAPPPAPPAPLVEKYRRNRELVARARELGLAGFDPLALGKAEDVVEAANLELEDRLARYEFEQAEVERQRQQEGLI